MKKKLKNRSKSTVTSRIGHFVNKYKKITYITIGLSYTILLYILTVDYIKEKDSCWFGGDVWEYQSIAVNYAKNYGFPVFGGLTEFKEYKFGYGDPGMINNYMKRNTIDFYRSPAYPFFLGIIYKLFGVDVAIAARIQLFMLSLIGGFLPVMGGILWKQKGFIAGLVSGIIYIFTNYKFSDWIMTETLIIFMLFLLAWAYIYAIKSKSKFSFFVLGITSGLLLLVKGSLVFIPLILGAYFLFQYLQKRNTKALINIAIFVFSMTFPVIPWSIYATQKSGSLVILTTQGNKILFDCHNEYIEGWWIANVWQKNENSYYNNDDPSQSNVKRVFSFYKNFPEKLYELPAKKIIAGFSPYLFFILFLTIYLTDSVVFITEKYFSIRKPLLNILVLLFIIGIVVFSYPADVFEPKNQNPALLAYNFNFFKEMSPTVPYVLLFTLTLLFIMRYKNNNLPEIPFIFYAFFLNFLIIAVVFIVPMKDIYWNRYIKVMDFAFILAFNYYLIWFIARNLDHIKKPTRN